MGANFHENASRRSRRNFRGFYFHAKLRGETTPTQTAHTSAVQLAVHVCAACPLVMSLFKHSRFLFSL